MYNMNVGIFVTLLALHITVAASANGEWNSCRNNSWVPYRERPNPASRYSFYACLYLVSVFINNNNNTLLYVYAT